MSFAVDESVFEICYELLNLIDYDGFTSACLRIH